MWVLKPYLFKPSGYFVNISQHQAYEDIRRILIKMKNQQYRDCEVVQILDRFDKISNNIQVRQIDVKRNSRTFDQEYSKQPREQYGYSQNHNYSGKIYQKKSVLLDQYGRQIPYIFSQLAALVLEMQKQKPKIGILYSNIEKQVHMTKKQVQYLLSLMALNLVPSQDYHRNFQNRQKFNRVNNFSHIFTHQLYKTKCIFEYFLKIFSNKNQPTQSQLFTLRRKVQRNGFSEILKQKKMNKMMRFKICQNQASIQEFIGKIKVDFANSYIGGGALTRGCVQEEIMFANHTQMYVSTLLCQAMEANESIFFIGFKKYFKNSGYSYRTRYERQDYLKYDTDSIGRVKQYISAIDAIEFKNNPMQQFQEKLIQRQVLKAYTGFNVDQSQSIVTGNWGCGAFKGNVSLKFLIQYLACSMAGKQMIYCPYGQKQMLCQKIEILESLKDKNVEQVYTMLINAAKKVRNPAQNMFHHMKESSKDFGPSQFFSFWPFKWFFPEQQQNLDKKLDKPEEKLLLKGPGIKKTNQNKNKKQKHFLSKCQII